MSESGFRVARRAMGLVRRGMRMYERRERRERWRQQREQRQQRPPQGEGGASSDEGPRPSA